MSAWKKCRSEIHDFVKYIQEEVLSRASAGADPAKGAIVPVSAAHCRRPRRPPRPHSASDHESPTTEKLPSMLPFKLIYSDCINSFCRSASTSFVPTNTGESMTNCSSPCRRSVRLHSSSTGIGPGHPARPHSAICAETQNRNALGTRRAGDGIPLPAELVRASGWPQVVRSWPPSTLLKIALPSTLAVASTMPSPIIW